jgi:hypothetical protein
LSSGIVSFQKNFFPVSLARGLPTGYFRPSLRGCVLGTPSTQARITYGQHGVSKVVTGVRKPETFPGKPIFGSVDLDQFRISAGWEKESNFLKKYEFRLTNFAEL